MTGSTVSFAGFDLAANVPGLRIIAHDPYRFPNRTLNTSQIANADKSVTTSAFYKDKKINVTVEIGQDTRDLRDLAIDALNTILQGHEQPLICSYAGGFRQWNATLSNITITTNQGGHGTFDIEFEAADPIGVDTASTPIFSNNLTGATNTVNFMLGGSCEWQQPITTITLSALTGGTNATITIGNTANGQTFSITQTFNPGDVIVIDSRLKIVTKNGTEIKAVGAIPEWAPNIQGGMSYADTFTSRTRAMSSIYYKRWV